MKNYAVIVDVLRTPMGRSKLGGAFFNVHPIELLARLFKAIVERNNLDPGTVDDVIVGCSNQIGEQSGTPGRVAWLGAGFPESVPSTTIDRKCGSGQQAIYSHVRMRLRFIDSPYCGIKTISKYDND